MTVVEILNAMIKAEPKALKGQKDKFIYMSKEHYYELTEELGKKITKYKNRKIFLVNSELINKSIYIAPSCNFNTYK